MSNLIIPKTVNQSLPPEWNLTQQWGKVAIRHCRHSCTYASGEDVWNFQDEHTIGLLLSPHPVRFTHKQDSQTHEGFYHQGDLLITPVNTTVSTRAEGDVQILQIRIQDSFIQQVAGEDLEQNSDRMELIQSWQTHDPQIQTIMMMLLGELHQTSFNSQLYIDSLTNVLAINLLRQHGTTKPKLPSYENGLSNRQMQQVLDYIDAHLGDEIKLADLAKLVGISQFHFSRLFKQSLGLSPHQYLLQQRVERAKQLLKKTDKPIIDIAFDCGFNSHSHLSTQFRQLTGMTPKAYRIN